MNTWRIKLGNSSLNQSNIDESFTAENVKARVDAVRALEEYANLLEALATGSKAEELKQASKCFTSSLLNVKSLHLTNQKAEAIGEVVNRIGMFATEGMRARAIRDIIPKANPAINELLALIREDFSPQGRHLGQSYERAAAGLLGDCAFIKETNLVAQALKREAAALAKSSQMRIASVSAQVIAVVDKLSAAQEQLLTTVQSSTSTTDRITDYVNQAHDCVELCRVLRAK